MLQGFYGGVQLTELGKFDLEHLYEQALQKKVREYVNVFVFSLEVLMIGKSSILVVARYSEILQYH